MRRSPSTRLVTLVSRVAVCALAIVLGAAAPRAQSSPGRADENAVKAAFLFNFAKFVQWPSPATRPILICVAAEDAFSDTLARLAQGASVDGRAVTPQPIDETDDPGGCDLMFVGAHRQKHGAELLHRVRTPTLTVGETAQFMRDGGMVRLFIEDNRLRFQINQKAAEANGLKLSSKLLALSR
jgi:hypothetical protein